MRLSTNGRKFLMNEEGLSLTAYPDPKLTPAQLAAGQVQKYSIGYGHSGAYKGQRITREEAEALLVQDIAKYEAAVSFTVPSATQAQFDAMVALCYNIGTAGFASSTVARLHNAGDYQGAADAFGMWRKSAGEVNPVLVARRARERTVYLGQGYPGVDTSTYTPAPYTPTPAPSPSVPSTPGTLPEPVWQAPRGLHPSLGVAGLSPLVVGACAAVAAYWALPKLTFARRALSIGA